MNNNDSRRIWGSVGILLVIILSTGSMFPLTVYAQESKGSFIEYSFNYLIEKSDVYTKSVKKEKPSSEIEVKLKQKKPVEKKESDEKSTINEQTKSKINADMKVETGPKKSRLGNEKKTKKPDSKAKLETEDGDKNKRDNSTKIKSNKKIVRRKAKTKEKETEDEKSKK